MYRSPNNLRPNKTFNNSSIHRQLVVVVQCQWVKKRYKKYSTQETDYAVHGDEGKRYSVNLFHFILFLQLMPISRTQTAYTFNLLASRYAPFESGNMKWERKSQTYLTTILAYFVLVFARKLFLRLNNKSVEARTKRL